MVTDDVPADDRRRIDALLEELLEQEPSQRESWLRGLDAVDRRHEPALRALLARVDGFLAEPLAGDALRHARAELVDERGGERVGPYTLVRPLGAGGMGTVWLAERSDGLLRRPVALKLPRSGWSPGVVARLEQERDRLAALEHPFIARLYDAGVTESGRPYLAMERIEGAAIDVHAREAALDVRDRVSLFLQVLEAVAYAHARLIVHLDLKPSNILVAADGTVRLLDFGAAKLLVGESTTASDLTREIGRALSPPYASPEQIRNEPATVASDVYSLGVVLYELLSGSRPYRLKRDTLGALEEAIARSDLRLASVAAAEGAGAARSKELRGDLDAILARALEGRPADRYPTVDAFRSDLQNWLARRPVSARRAGALYVAERFVARNRGGVAVGLLALISLVGGLTFAIHQAAEARHQAERAERANAFLAAVFREAKPKVGIGGTVTAVDVLQQAIPRLDGEFADDPRAAAELGLVLVESLDALGYPFEDEGWLRRQYDRARSALGADDPLAIRSGIFYADAVRYRNPEEGLPLFADLVPRAERQQPALLEELLFALDTRAFSLAKLNREEESYADLRRAIALAERGFGPDDPRTIKLLGKLANTHGRFGRRALQLAAAEDAFRRSRQSLVLRRPEPTLLAVERWYADALVGMSRPRDAVPLYELNVADARRLDGGVSMNVRSALIGLGNALIATGRCGDGLRALREAVRLEREQNPVDSDDRVAYSLGLSSGLLTCRWTEEALAEIRRGDGYAAKLPARPPRSKFLNSLRMARALAQLGEDAAVQATLNALPEDAERRFPELARDALGLRAYNDRLQGRLQRAQAVLDEAIDAPGFAEVASGVRMSLLGERAQVRLDLGDVAGGSADADECLRIAVETQSDGTVRLSACHLAAARAQLAQGRASQATAALTALDGWWQDANTRSPGYGEVLWWRARALAAAGDAAQAQAVRAVAVALLRPSPVPLWRNLAGRIG